MARERNFRIPLIVVIIAATLFTRCSWLTDMEYKSDEKETVRIAARYTFEHFTPIAPVSNHSGLAHSAGFFYFLHYLTQENDPLAIVTFIATFNALAIAASLYFLRRSIRYVYMYALCATSLALVVGSRKIWTPDLQATVGVPQLGANWTRR